MQAVRISKGFILTGDIHPCLQVSGDATFCNLDDILQPTPAGASSLVTAVGNDTVDAVSIGRPLPGAYASIVDSDLRPTPMGQPGELIIGGILVALGYHRRPRETAEKFLYAGINIPGLPEGRRAFRTGDKVIQRSEGGPLFWLGRLDSEVRASIDSCLDSRVQPSMCLVLVREQMSRLQSNDDLSMGRLSSFAYTHPSLPTKRSFIHHGKVFMDALHHRFTGQSSWHPCFFERGGEVDVQGGAHSIRSCGGCVGSGQGSCNAPLAGHNKERTGQANGVHGDTCPSSRSTARIHHRGGDAADGLYVVELEA